jgi:hypothetical protein
MKIETVFVARWISIAKGENAIGKQSQTRERAGTGRGRSRGGATDGCKWPQGGNQGARQRWLLDIYTQPLNVDA